MVGGVYTRVVAIVLGVVVLATAGCGGDDRAKAVDEYVGEVNLVQRDLATHVGQFNLAYRSFAGGRELERLVPDLAAVEKALAATHARLERLRPPEDASRLHPLLLRLVEAQQGLAHEVTAFARYQPALRRVFAPLAASESRLRSGIADAANADAQAREFAEFRRAVTRAERELDGLVPPLVLRAAHEAQRKRLAALADVTQQLAARLRAANRLELEPLLRRYGRLIAQTDTAAQRRERTAAVRAYNARVRRIDAIAGDVRRELARLRQSLSR